MVELNCFIKIVFTHTVAFSGASSQPPLKLPNSYGEIIRTDKGLQTQDCIPSWWQLGSLLSKAALREYQNKTWIGIMSLFSSRV